jgi:predicted HTH transcriptional regulator
MFIFGFEMTADEKYISDLIAEGEHQQQDFKFEISSARKIAKTLVAFANTDGGRLLIGVKDNGRVAGIKSDEEYYMIDAAASMYCKPEISFKSYSRNFEGKTILEIVIEASSEKPHFAQDENNKWLAYHRVEDNNFLADYILLQVWKREKRDTGTFIEYTENEQRILNALQDLGSSDMTALVKYLPMNKRRLRAVLINLVALRSVEMVYIGGQVFFRLNE